MNQKERPRSSRLLNQQPPVVTVNLQSDISNIIDKEMGDIDVVGAKEHLVKPLRQHALRTALSGYMEKVNIGPEYQAEIPDFVPPTIPASAYRDDKDVETLIWSPTEDGDEDKLHDFVDVATRSNNYSIEQAITLLQTLDHDYDKAMEQVTHFANTKALWSQEEKQQFDLLLALHGTKFDCLKEGMPNRSLAEIIDHYFTTVPQRDQLSYSDFVLKTGNETPSPLGNEGLLALAKNNSSAWQCGENCHQVKILQARILAKQANLAASTSHYLEDRDELRRMCNTGNYRNIREWRPMDKILFELAFQDHGCDFALIARILRNKNEQQVREYYEATQKATETTATSDDK